MLSSQRVRRFLFPSFGALSYIVLILSAMTAALPLQVAAQTSQYTITQVTSGAFDHMWPAINNKGDIVWSQQVNGLWQVFIQPGAGGGPSPIVGPDPAHNFQFPDISDSGRIVCQNEGASGGS